MINKLLRSKKAYEGDVSFLNSIIPYIIIAVIFTGCVTAGQQIAVQNLKLSNNIVDARVGRFITEYRFANSPDCFAYYDADSKRTYPGITDIDKFTQSRMQACYNVAKDSDKRCFKLELQDFKGERKGTLYSANWAQKCATMPLLKEARNLVCRGSAAVM